MKTKQKNIAVVFLALFSLTGCDEIRKNSNFNVAGFKNCEIVVIDSCEYIMYRAAGSYNHITHKGNCKFCEKRNQTRQTK